MRRLSVVAFALAIVAVAGVALAAEESRPATGPGPQAGRQGGQGREVTLKLKLDGDKLTGSMLGRDGEETKIDRRASTRMVNFRSA